MTTKQYVAQLDKRLKEIENANHFLPCVQGLHNEQVARIFDFGQGGERQIGQYSTTPTYISKSQSPKSFGTPTGKTGKSKFTSGKKKGQQHTSKYFAGGYRQFREVVGREASFVNLFLTGELRRDFSNSLTKNGAMWQSGVKRAENSGKVDGSVDRFGEQTWHVTEQERKEFSECCKRQRLKKKI